MELEIMKLTQQIKWVLRSPMGCFVIGQDNLEISGIIKPKESLNSSPTLSIKNIPSSRSDEHDNQFSLINN